MLSHNIHLKVAQEVNMHLKLDKNFLKQYINEFNNKLENNYVDDNYCVGDFELLDQMYNECICYILREIRKII